MSKKYLKFFLSAFLTSYFLLLTFSLSHLPVQAANDTMPHLQIPIPDLSLSNKVFDSSSFRAPECTGEGKNQVCKIYWISQYIAEIYKYAIGIIGILATVVMMIGGVIWLTAGGNASRIGEAQSWIGASITGLVIALSSYMILYQINPDLLNLKPIEVSVVSKIAIATDTSCSWQKGTLIDIPNDQSYYNCPDGSPYADEGKCSGNKPDYNYVCCCPTPTCQTAKTGPCTEDNLKSTCFGNNTSEASSICMAESSGNQSATNAKATCSYNGQQYNAVFGLFQINISANSIWDGGTKYNCSSAFDKAYSNSSTACNITNFSLYTTCMDKMLSASSNIETACHLSNNGTNWGPWEANSTKCHF